MGQTVKVSRVKLLERLAEVKTQAEADDLKRGEEQKKATIQSIYDRITRAQEELAAIRSGKTTFHRRSDVSAVEKSIRLLELSDEESVIVRATSDVYKYL